MIDFEDPAFAEMELQRFIDPRKGVYVECDKRFGRVFVENRFRSTLQHVYLGKPDFRGLYARIIRLQDDCDIHSVETYLPNAQIITTVGSSLHS